MPSSHYNSFSSSSQVVGTSSHSSDNSPTHQHLASSVDGRCGLDTYYASSSLISPTTLLYRSGYPSSLPPSSTPATPFLSTIPLPVLAPLARYPSPLQPEIFSMLRNFPPPQSSSRSFPTLLNDSPATSLADGVNIKNAEDRASANLVVNVGTGGTLSWAAAKPDFAHFFALHDRSNSLEITWRLSPLDGCNELGYSFLQKLFRYLHQERSHEMNSLPPASMLFSTHTTRPIRARPISTIDQVSITVPSHVELEAIESFLGPNSVCVDLLHASRLHELAWDGDFSFLVNSLERIPLSQLTKLSISGCHMSVNDILSLMDQCPNLLDGAFGIIEDMEGAGKRDIMKRRKLPGTSLPEIIRLELTANTSLGPVFQQLRCPKLTSLSLNVYRGEDDLLRALQMLSTDESLSMSIKANLTDAHVTKLQALYPEAQVYPFYS